MEKFIAAIDGLSEATGKVLAWLIVPMALIVLYTASMRYFFNIAVPWGFETSLFCFGIQCIVGGAYCLKHCGHVGVDVITNRLPRRYALVMEIIGFLLVIFVAVVMIYLGQRWAMNATRIVERSIHGTQWNPQIWWFKWMIPLAGLLVGLQALSQIFKNILALKKKGGE